MNTRFHIYCLLMFVLLICTLTPAPYATAHPGHKHQSGAASTKKPAVGGKTLTMRLAGLHCEGCAMIVKDSLEKVPGVVSARVSQPKQTAILTLGKTMPSPKRLKAAVVKAGYKVVRIE